MCCEAPAFLTEALTGQYGEALCARIVDGMRARRLVSLRANTLKTTPEAVSRALSEAGLAYERAAFSDCAFSLPEAKESDVRRLPLYENGEIYLQSLSSMLPPLALSPAPRADILDMAAAPGGKTAQLSALSDGQAAITACEINRIRAEKLKFNLTRQGVPRVNVMVCDARKLDSFLRFDQILLDAPCSGSGTLLLCRPETLRAFSAPLVRNSAQLQKQLLRKGLSLLKPGGTLVYSTCSVLEAENEAVVRAALADGTAALEPVAFPGLEALPRLPAALPGTLCLCPTARYEGFFIAKFRRQ